MKSRAWLTRPVSLVLCVLLLLPLSACGMRRSESERFDRFLQKTFQNEMNASNQLDVHYLLDDPSTFGIKKKWVPTLGRYETEEEEAASGLAQMEERILTFNREELTDAQKVDYDVLLQFVQMQRRFDGLLWHQEPNTLSGAQSQLPVFLAEYRLETEEDVKNYLKLTRDLDDYYTSMLEFQCGRSERGLFMSDFAADAVIAGLEDFIRDPEQNFMLAVFDTKIDAVEGLTEEERQRYRDKNRDAVLQTVIPASRELASGLRELKGTGKNEAGLCHLEDGSAYYEALVAQSTGSSRTVEEMAAFLEERMNLLLGELGALMRSNPEADFDAMFTARLDLSDPTLILLDLQERIQRDFPALGEIRYQIKEVHPSLQQTMAQRFTSHHRWTRRQKM